MSTDPRIEAAIRATDKEIEAYGAHVIGGIPEPLFGPTSDMPKEAFLKGLAAYQDASIITSKKQFNQLNPGTVARKGDGDVYRLEFRGTYGVVNNAQYWLCLGWEHSEPMTFDDLQGARILHWGTE